MSAYPRHVPLAPRARLQQQEHRAVTPESDNESDDDQDDVPAIVDTPILEYFVIKQEVELNVNFRDRCIDGTTDIYIVTFSDKLEEILLDAAQCQINTDAITITDMREVNGEAVEGYKRKAAAEYTDPYSKLSHPKGRNWQAEHHDLRRIRSRRVFHSRKTDIAAENREFEGCTPVYGSLKIRLRGREDQERPRLIIRKSTLGLDSNEKSHRQLKITVPFINKNPRDGIHFVGVDPLDKRYTHMYTRHSLQPGTASCIFPCIDDHGSRCDWKITIKFPRTMGDALNQALASKKDDRKKDRSLVEEDKLREMFAVCSGFLMEEGIDPKDDRKKIMVFEPEKKVSVQKLGFAIGPFEHIDLSSEFRTEEDEVKLGISALKVYAYCLPRRGDWVRHTCAALTMAADYFTYSFARYPFDNFKLVFLEDMEEDTTIVQSLAFASNRLLYPGDIMETEIEVTRKLVFTLTSQWIGINMIPNTRHDLWLVLGIAHYMTDIFMKKLCGNNEYRFRVKTMSDELIEKDVGRPSLYDIGPALHLGAFEEEFLALKAPVVLFILDKRLVKVSGGYGLTRILQKLLTKAQIEGTDRSTILDTEKFRVTCEKGARYQLEAFWNQWVYGSGCPRFDVKARFNKKRLCVELFLEQVQRSVVKEPLLEKDGFLRAIKERRAEVPIGDVQALFTGPMTVRIHEADGTPYEHILEIRDDGSRAKKFEIPYNTKYKRLKRTRRIKEKNSAGASMTDNADESLLYSLGDVLQTPEEMKDWELTDWDSDTEKKMDQESYEWIRLDADFEWACDVKRPLPAYMYVSQLQQDRDVVAQQDAILYLANGPLHPIAAGFLSRTLYDSRYFHGIRSQAAHALTRQANIKDLPMRGLRQLMRAFREMYCYGQTNQPLPNDFSDKRQYHVRCSILKAISAVRNDDHRCPIEARRLIMDQLRLNNNEHNPYSDHLYIAMLVEYLAQAMIPSQKDDWLARQKRIQTAEETQFIEDAVEQIERVLRRDEWTHSYQNCWTISGLDAKQRLMKADIIPKRMEEFLQYLLDGTKDLIRIKSFDALIDLGAIADPTLFAFLMYALMTDRSPYVRKRLIESLARGLAAVAFGEQTEPTKQEPTAEEADGLLLVQDSAAEIEARKEMFARKENLDAALRALKKEMDLNFSAHKDQLNAAVQKAMDHPDLGRDEVDSLLDIASMMFDEAEKWILSLQYPKAWRVQKVSQHKHKSLIMSFRSRFRTKPKVPLPPINPDVKRPITLQRSSSIKITTKPAATPQRTALPGAAGAATNGVKSALGGPPVNGNAARRSASATPGPVPKRPLDDKAPSPAPKRPKTEVELGSAITRKVVTLRTSNPARLAVILGQPLPTSTPSTVRTALPGAAPRPAVDATPKPARKPLPGSVERTPVPMLAPAPAPAPAPTPSTPAVSSAAAPKIVAATPVAAPPKPALPVLNTTPAGAATHKPAAAPETPVSARPKIKIIRKPQPPPAA